MNHDLMLLYTEPADVWAEALPVGNGRLGAMVCGGFPVERIHLNEDTFWSGPGDIAVPAVPEGLLESVRDHIRAGRRRRGAFDAGRGTAAGVRRGRRGERRDRGCGYEGHRGSVGPGARGARCAVRRR
ncbi:glycoside hydrolase N-terminal domain-containing protein [Streptomyces albicerus]|uniref:glycoside hydrolase N-terminal domain-containing protein n=1 Tax=Streptomyces albicerus TaxID=2569859 RepID=UPI00124B308C|nr:glycoside hydrolase N-terminal domain-containing protein [Streptomyces albicerus]